MHINFSISSADFILSFRFDSVCKSLSFIISPFFPANKEKRFKQANQGFFRSFCLGVNDRSYCLHFHSRLFSYQKSPELTDCGTFLILEAYEKKVHCKSIKSLSNFAGTCKHFPYAQFTAHRFIKKNNPAKKVFLRCFEDLLKNRMKAQYADLRKEKEENG